MQDSIIKLSSHLSSKPITPGDEAYDRARKVYNAMHDCRPAVVVEARDVADVVATINFARESSLLLAVRGGGHSVPGFGTCDDGVVLDLGRMNSTIVDPKRRSVIAQGGCTQADVDHATHAYDLAVPGGTVSTTGLAGLTLGGGMGHLSRGFGLSCDRLRSAEVVIAAGDILHCDASEHADLFWAIRGGGGNFGVTTHFQFDAVPLDTVYGGPTLFRVDGEVMRRYQQLILDAPEALNALFAIALAPPAPFVPEDWHSKPVMIVLTCWSGASSEDESIRERVAGLGDVVGQAFWRMPYPEINTFFDELLPAGLRHYWKANAAERLSDEAIATHLEYGPRVGNLESGMFMFPINGACHRVSPDETAFANRHCTFSAVIAGTWHDQNDDDAYIAWVRDYHAALEPWSEAGGYVNFMAGDERDEVDQNYGPMLTRLRAIKESYDPENLFRLNANIQPRP